MGVSRLVLIGVVIGAVLTGLAGAARGSQGLNELTWVGTVATITALVVAVGIYRLQRADQTSTHNELLDRLDAQDELLGEFAHQTAPAVPSDDAEALTPAQRDKVEAIYGADVIDAAWKLGAGRGNRPRLVRLKDGRLVSVYSGGRRGGTYVHAVETSPRS